MTRRSTKQLLGRGVSAIATWTAIVLGLTASAAAHVMSMSSGELEVVNNRAVYELRMPLYEITHLEEPERTLLENIRLTSVSGEARRLKGSCKADAASGWYRCRSVFEFAGPIEQLDVECNFAAVTVPNHVHLLRATRGDVTKQAVFDFSFTHRTIRFTPPTEAEIALTELWTGAARVMGGPVQLLFLVALALAGRNRKELLYLAFAFIGAETVSAVVVAAKSWQPAPRFIEAAAALTVAYLAVEILLLPDARYRWLIAAGMGVFHGFYFGTFMQELEMEPIYVLTGVAVTEAAVLALFAWLLSQVTKVASSLRPVQIGAALLGIVGMVWFVLRMRS